MAQLEQPRHYAGIDGLRALSCLAIIAMHVLANTEYAVSGFLFDTLIPAGTQMVYLFLMISGFGLCCGYLERFQAGTITPDSFYRKRYGKILPFFALLVVLDVAMTRTPESLYEGFLELTMVFGLLPNNELQVIGVGWTVGVIFLFYMLFPFFVFLLHSKKRAWLSFAVSLGIHALCKTYFFTEQFVVAGFSPRHSFLYCAPFFLAGGLVYLYRREITAFLKKWRYLALAGAAALSVLWFLTPGYAGTYSLGTEKMLLVCAAWLSYAVGTDSRFLSCRPMRFLSGISMEMYLAHMVVFRILEKAGLLYLLGRGWASYVLALLLTLGVLVAAISVYKLAEKKLRQELRKRKEAKEA